MQRNGFLDFAKGVLIILVVVGHAIQYVVYRDVDCWDDPLFKGIYIFHMPLFMAISGYLSFAGLQNITDVRAYLSRRSLSYLVPIISWATLYQVLLTGFSADATLAELPLAIGREAIWSQWFLWALLGSIVVMVVATRFGRFSLPVMAAMFCGFLALPELGNVYLFTYTFPFFVAGYYTARYPDVLARAAKSLLLLVSGIVTMSLGFPLWDDETYVYVTKMSVDDHNADNIALRWVLGAIGALVVLGILQRLHATMPARWARPVEVAGRDSLYIYILQGYAFLALPSLIQVGRAGTFTGMLWAIAIGIVVAAVCWAVGSLIAANHHVARILFGQAKKPPSRFREESFSAAEQRARGPRTALAGLRCWLRVGLDGLLTARAQHAGRRDADEQHQRQGVAQAAPGAQARQVENVAGDA